MPTADANGISLHYDTFGDPADPTMVLVSGLGTQMIMWLEEFCESLVDRCFHVVRFDNRDSGLSTRFDEPVDLMAVQQAVASGESPPVPYRLADMASDVVGLLDALGIDSAHVVGASLGGMVAQRVAIDHPTRVRSLTSMMSTTGAPDVGQPSREALVALLEPTPLGREAVIAAGLACRRIWGSPDHLDEDALRAYFARCYDRAPDGDGANRQFAAVLVDGSRDAELATVRCPALVVHGDHDVLIHPSGGERTAAVLPDAELLMLEGLGHDLPSPYWQQVIESLTRLAIRTL
ncbi:MAG: alpha/beta hydrolase [Acidimicrobiales bacterium]|nr:alpha/beta hydrolase [Acidimicrobiales bacterium]